MRRETIYNEINWKKGPFWNEIHMIPIFRYVFWYHEERMVNYDLSSTSSVSVKTTEESGITKSVLTIANADPKDAGNYTCKPSNAIAASIQVFVSEGKKK